VDALAISKYSATVVAGSMPPRDHAYVPPSPISVSATHALVFLRDVQGPMAPMTCAREADTSATVRRSHGTPACTGGGACRRERRTPAVRVA
jgi:hypothetical protein